MHLQRPSEFEATDLLVVKYSFLDRHCVDQALCICTVFVNRLNRLFASLVVWIGIILIRIQLPVLMPIRIRILPKVLPHWKI